MVAALANDAGSSQHGVKRLKNSSVMSTSATDDERQMRPKLFAPFRALGLVTNHIPFALSLKHGGKDANAPSVNIVACIGTSWMMWDVDRMVLLFVGQALPEQIQALVIAPGSSGNDSIYACAGDRVYKFVRGRLVAELKTSEKAIDAILVDREGEISRESGLEDSRLSTLSIVGDNLLSLSQDGSRLFIWSLTDGTLRRSISLARRIPSTRIEFSATAILHPDTYVDKVLLGGSAGDLQLWNFRSSTLLHHFSAATLLEYASVTTGPMALSHAVVDLVQTPAIDVVAVGYSTGHILLHDIRYDEPILCAHINSSDNSGASNVLKRGSISFRTDNMAHTMAVGTCFGDIVLFDLEMPTNGASTETSIKRARPARLAHTIRVAHDASIGSLQFIQGQPLLISAGSDNAIKQWFFEASSFGGTNGKLGESNTVGSTTVPRVLKSREGHSQPPRLIRFVGEDGKTIITAGSDDRSVRAMSVVRDSRSAEISQGDVQSRANKSSRRPVSLKLPAITSLAFSSARSRDWDDILTTHKGSPYAHTWFLRDRRKGKAPLPAFNPDTAIREGTSQASLGSIEGTATCISACGNFGMIGNSAGFVEVYNMQSVRWRRRYDPRKLLKDPLKTVVTKAGDSTQRPQMMRVKGSPVSGIVSDAVNRTVVVATLDGSLTFFDFQTNEVVKAIESGSGIARMYIDRDTNLLATIHDDLQIRMYDVETHRLVRNFSGFRARVTDLTFSPDGRWLVTSSLDGSIRTFDIPSGRLVDAFRTPTVATSVTFSPMGDFLATTHVASLGVYLWANRAQFSGVTLTGIDEDSIFEEAKGTGINLPTLRGLEDMEDPHEEHDTLRAIDIGEGELQRTYTTPQQLFVSSERRPEEDGLITLSTMPRSRWMTLLNLDVIRLRDKSKEAPRKPERIPFFLPQGSASDSAIGPRKGLAEELTNEAEDSGKKKVESRRLMSISKQGLDFESDFAKQLRLAVDKRKTESLFLYLHSLAPPAVDSELRSLVRLVDLTNLLRCFILRLRQHLDYEAIQAMLAVTLRVHGDLIASNGIKMPLGNTWSSDMDFDRDDGLLENDAKALGEALRELMVEQHREGNRVMELLEYCVGSTSFVRNLPLTS